MGQGSRFERCGGAAMVEFSIAAPVLLLLGLGTAQAGLAYHARTTLNYATFEAARVGATRHARKAPMLDELGIRLAPLIGGDGSDGAAASAIMAASVLVRDPRTFTDIRIINPSREAFDHFQVASRESGEPVIPNSHLRHRYGASEKGPDPVSGVTLQDANLLKIEATHALELKVPLMAGVLRWASGTVLAGSPDRHVFAMGKLPLRSVATVRMQSEVHADDLLAAAPPVLADGPLESTALGDGSGTFELPPGDLGQADDLGFDASAAGEDPNELCGGPVGVASGAGPGDDPFLPTLDAQSCAVAVEEATSIDADAEDTPSMSELCGV